MKRRLIYVILPVLAIILEILPFGAVLNFGIPATDGSVGFFRETFSYFDLTPFGYGHFGCLITAILTCILLIFGVVYLFKDSIPLKKATTVLSFTTALISLSPFLLGLSFISVSGVFISFLLILEFVFLKFINF